jgi:hypothetical protein
MKDSAQFVDFVLAQQTENTLFDVAFMTVKYSL